MKLIKTLKTYLNPNLSNISVNLQANIEDIPQAKPPTGVSHRKMNPQDTADIKLWIKLINDAYDDADADIKTFDKHINNHSFLDITDIYFLILKDKIVGTVSIGTYHRNPVFGGDARIAIKKSAQGIGLGKYSILFAFEKLQKRGIKKAESVIKHSRHKSIYLHFKCGFKPQTNRKKVVCNNQKRFWLSRMIINRKINKMYKSFRLDNYSNSFNPI